MKKIFLPGKPFAQAMDGLRDLEKAYLGTQYEAELWAMRKRIAAFSLENQHQFDNTGGIRG